MIFHSLQILFNFTLLEGYSTVMPYVSKLSCHRAFSLYVLSTLIYSLTFLKIMQRW